MTDAVGFGVIAFLCTTPSTAEIIIQPPTSSHASAVYPHFKIRVPLLGVSGNGAKHIANIYNAIRTSLQPLVATVSAQLQHGDFGRARLYAEEVEEALTLTKELMSRQGPLKSLRQCNTIGTFKKNLQMTLPEFLNTDNSARLAGTLQLLALSIGNGIDLESCRPDALQGNQIFPMSTPEAWSLSELTKLDPRLRLVDNVAMYTTNQVLIAALERNNGYDVIIQNHHTQDPLFQHSAERCSPFDMGSLSIGVNRVRGEHKSSFNERVHTAIRVAFELAPKIAVNPTHAGSLTERWSCIHYLSSEAQLHYAKSVCLLPLPHTTTGWRCLVRAPNMNLREILLDDPNMALLASATWVGSPGPDLGAGLSQNDNALRDALHLLQTLATPYWSGSKSALADARARCYRSLKAVVRPEWWQTFSELNPAFLSWLKRDV